MLGPSLGTGSFQKLNSRRSWFLRDCSIFPLSCLYSMNSCPDTSISRVNSHGRLSHQKRHGVIYWSYIFCAQTREHAQEKWNGILHVSIPESPQQTQKSQWSVSGRDFLYAPATKSWSTALRPWPVKMRLTLHWLSLSFFPAQDRLSSITKLNSTKYIIVCTLHKHAEVVRSEAIVQYFTLFCLSLFITSVRAG